MKKIVLLCIGLLSGSPRGSSQALFAEGDSFIYAFTSANLVLFGHPPPPYQPVFGETLVQIHDASLPAGTTLRYEMFENSTSDTPICTRFITAPFPAGAACDVNNVWGDLQGVVRLTMVSGSVTVDSVSLQVGRFSNGVYERWTGVAIPSPSPQLSITRLNDAQLQVTWTTNHADFILESGPGVAATSWKPVTNGVATAGDRFSVVLRASNAQEFFRLRKNSAGL